MLIASVTYGEPTLRHFLCASCEYLQREDSGRYSRLLGFCNDMKLTSCEKISAFFSGASCSGWPAILVVSPASVLSSSPWVAGLLRVIWRWRPNHTFLLSPNPGSSLPEQCYFSTSQSTPLTPDSCHSHLRGVLPVGRAMRVVDLLGNGGVAHLFVVYGYPGADKFF